MTLDFGPLIFSIYTHSLGDLSQFLRLKYHPNLNFIAPAWIFSLNYKLISACFLIFSTWKSNNISKPELLISPSQPFLHPSTWSGQYTGLSLSLTAHRDLFRLSFQSVYGVWPLLTTPTVAIWSTSPSPWWWPQSLISLPSLLSKAAAWHFSQIRSLCFIQSKSQNPSRALLDLGTLTFLLVPLIPCPPRWVSLLFLEHIKNTPCLIASAPGPFSAWTLLSSSKLMPCFYIALTSLFKCQLLNEATLTTLFKVPDLTQSPGFPHPIIYYVYWLFRVSPQ